MKHRKWLQIIAIFPNSGFEPFRNYQLALWSGELPCTCSRCFLKYRTCFSSSQLKLRNGASWERKSKTARSDLLRVGTHLFSFSSAVRESFWAFQKQHESFLLLQASSTSKRPHWCTIRWAQTVNRPRHKILFRWILTHQSFLYSILCLEWIISKISVMLGSRLGLSLWRKKKQIIRTTGRCRFPWRCRKQPSHNHPPHFVRLIPRFGCQMTLINPEIVVIGTLWFII